MEPTAEARNVLAVVGNPGSMEPLFASLRELGARIDVVADLEGARNAFFCAGGHDLLLLGPDVAPGVAEQVVGALRALDAGLGAIAFGDHLARLGMTGVGLVPDFHPDSRAGLGAVLRVLAAPPAGG